MSTEMNTEYISELLHRFMQGETTEQEEQALADYFSTATYIPAEWSDYAALFSAFEQGQPCFSEEEMNAFAIVPLRQPRRRAWYWVAGIAASFLIVIGMATWLYLKPDGQEKAVALQKPTPIENVKEEMTSLPSKHQDEKPTVQKQQVAIASPVHSPSGAGTNPPPNLEVTLPHTEKTSRETRIEETTVVYSDEFLLAMSTSIVTSSEIKARGEHLMQIIEEEQQSVNANEISAIYP